MSKRIPIIISVVLLALILAACAAPSTPAPQPTATAVPVVNTPPMGEAEAKQIAAQSSECTQAGTLQDTATYNPNSNTWWIDIKADKPGCSPACVVNAATKQAEVNWRCTGAGVPTETPRPMPTWRIPLRRTASSKAGRSSFKHAAMAANMAFACLRIIASAKNGRCCTVIVPWAA